MPVPKYPKSKSKAGHPPKFKTPAEMQTAIDTYFASCDPHLEEYIYIKTDPKTGKQTIITAQHITDQRPYTMTGLANALGFESRQSLVDYKKRESFSDTIKQARRRVEEYVEERMLASTGVVAGIIFNAKNNFGWVDKQEVDNNNTLNGGLTVKWED